VHVQSQWSLHWRGRTMSNAQLYLSIGVPVIANAVLVGLLLAYMNAKFENVSQRFEAVDRRFDDMRALWLAELHRVEEVLDARLKPFEER